MGRRRTPLRRREGKKKAKNFKEYVEGQHVQRHNAVLAENCKLTQKDLVKIYDWEHARNVGFDHRSSSWLRREAVKSITDANLLEKIALDDCNEGVRKQALIQSKNNVNLLNKAKQDHSKKVRDYANCRLGEIENSIRFIMED